MSRGTIPFFAICLTSLSLATPVVAQQVCLPAPRLLTVTPMGGQLGTTVDVTITHQNGDGIRELLFSTSKISAKPLQGADGKVVPNRFQITIAPDAPVGVHDARLLTSLGVSAARTFVVGGLPEVTRTKENQSLETAWALQANSVCNAATSKRAVDYYSFKGAKGRRVVIDCNAARIDSKLSPVVILADSKGNDLLVNRTSGVLDYTPESDGTYFIKIHDLTFQGGTEHFYRLALREMEGSGSAPRQEMTARVNAFSWPPEGLVPVAPVSEVEPNNEPSQAQKITLPCDLAGSFTTGEDTDIFEFQASKGEVWWVEVASERLGLNTDPAVLVQRVVKDGEKETVTDIAELDDMAAPMKMGTYQPAASYSGPAYQAGSPDVLGKFEVKEDGVYRLQLRNLTSDTRSRGNVYRLIIRKAQPDFALVAWAAHQRLRQNDFGTISKPIALRAGTTMAFEVVTVRRDGFDGEINLGMEDLPPGVTATGLTIPAGKVQGMLFITAAEGATPAFSIAKIVGRASVNGNVVTRPCRLASVLWPVDYAPNELPKSRLVSDVPVSVTDFEKAPVSVAADGSAGFQVNVGETVKIPLRVTWRSEFNGTSIKLKPFGSVFGGLKEIDLPIKAATMEAVLDLASLKTPPGDYTLAFSGIGVIKHRPNQDAVKATEAEQKKVSGEVASLAAEAKAQAEKAATSAPAEGKEEATKAAKAAAEKHKAAEAAMAEVTKRLKALTDAAATKDILDFIVSEPIQISVKPAPAAQTASSQTPVAPGAASSGTAVSPQK